MSIETLILLILKTSIVLIVFAMGLDAVLSEATFLFRQPRRLVRALLSMYLVMPLVAFVLARTLGLEPVPTIAIVTLALCPVPPILPKRALRAGGRQDYTLGLLVAAALLAIVVIPVALEIIERFVSVRLQMSPVDVAVIVFTTVLAPLLTGIAVRAFAPSIADMVAKPIAIVGAVLLFLGILPVLFVMTRTLVSLAGNGTVLGLGAFAVAGLISGHLLGGPGTEDRRVLALATAVRHPAVAMSIVQVNFPEEQRLIAATVFLYLIISGIVSGVYLRWARNAPADTTPRDRRSAA